LLVTPINYVGLVLSNFEFNILFFLLSDRNSKKKLPTIHETECLMFNFLTFILKFDNLITILKNTMEILSYSIQS
jgi:hypothetical protein